VEAVVERVGRLSSGSWKGRETPSIPKPSGREGAEPSRLLPPAVETWERKEEEEEIVSHDDNNRGWRFSCCPRS